MLNIQSIEGSKMPGIVFGGSQTPGIGFGSQRPEIVFGSQRPEIVFGGSASSRSFTQKATTPELGQLKAVQTSDMCKDIYCTCLHGEKCPTISTVPWWLTMSHEKANALFALKAEKTLAYMQAASTPEALEAKAKEGSRSSPGKERG